MSSRKILNSVATDQDKGGEIVHVVSLEQLGLDLQRMMLSLKVQFLAEDGRGVDYQKLRGSPEFQEYNEIAGKLNHVELKGSSEIERIAFFISIHQLTLLLYNYVLTS